MSLMRKLRLREVLSLAKFIQVLSVRVRPRAGAVAWIPDHERRLALGLPTV